MVVVLLAAVVQHYMLSYHMVMDPSMVANVLQTDPHEARDLISWRLLFNVLGGGAARAVARARAHRRRCGSGRSCGATALLLFGAVALAVVAARCMQRELAPLMRNNVHLRYMMNPVASLYSAGAVALQAPVRAQPQAGADQCRRRALGASYAGAGPAAAVRARASARPRGPTTSRLTAMRATPRPSWRRARC